MLLYSIIFYEHKSAYLCDVEIIWHLYKKNKKSN